MRNDLLLDELGVSFGRLLSQMVGAAQPGTQILGKANLARRDIRAAVVLSEQLGQSAFGCVAAAVEGLAVDLALAASIAFAGFEFQLPGTAYRVLLYDLSWLLP